MELEGLERRRKYCYRGAMRQMLDEGIGLFILGLCAHDSTDAYRFAYPITNVTITSTTHP